MRAPRPLHATLVAALATAAGSCGGGSNAQVRPLRPVSLTVNQPNDAATTRRTSVGVRGHVDPPGAAVSVLGHPAEVTAGSFNATVDLQPGINLIDLAATAPGRGPAMTALRVTLEMPVVVPDLGGLTPDDARRRVEALGLRLDVRDIGGLLDPILPGSPGVCEQDPGKGRQVVRGSTVHVLVAKRC